MVTNVKINEIIDLWLEWKRSFVKESTYAAYMILIKNHIRPYFGEKSDIYEDDVQNFVLLKLESNLKVKTVKDILIVVKMIVKYAVKKKMLEYKDLDISFPSNYNSLRLEILSKYDQNRLIKYLKNNFTFSNFGIILCLHTGLRIGELCALKWKDINVETGVLTVNKTLQRVYDVDSNMKSTKLIIDNTKTKNSEREIPLSNEIVRIIKPFLKILSLDYFVLSNNFKPIEPRTYREHFKKTLFNLGINNIKFHGLRHTFATRCIESRADYKTVSSILGHSNINTTLSLYVHPTNDHKKKCIENMIKNI